jgi:hypothetical protein
MTVKEVIQKIIDALTGNSQQVPQVAPQPTGSGVGPIASGSGANVPSDSYLPPAIGTSGLQLPANPNVAIVSSAPANVPVFQGGAPVTGGGPVMHDDHTVNAPSAAVAQSGNAPAPWSPDWFAAHPVGHVSDWAPNTSAYMGSVMAGNSPQDPGQAAATAKQFQQGRPIGNGKYAPVTPPPGWDASGHYTPPT